MINHAAKHFGSRQYKSLNGLSEFRESLECSAKRRSYDSLTHTVTPPSLSLSLSLSRARDTQRSCERDRSSFRRISTVWRLQTLHSSFTWGRPRLANASSPHTMHHGSLPVSSDTTPICSRSAHDTANRPAYHACCVFTKQNRRRQEKSHIIS